MKYNFLLTLLLCFLLCSIGFSQKSDNQSQGSYAVISVNADISENGSYSIKIYFGGNRIETFGTSLQPRSNDMVSSITEALNYLHNHGYYLDETFNIDDPGLFPGAQYIMRRPSEINSSIILDYLDY